MLTKPDTIVCRCESLTQTCISQEVEAGAASTNAVKSGLRAGMGHVAANTVKLLLRA